MNIPKIKAPRNLSEVILAMISEIPYGQGITGQLVEVRQSAMYAAPENMRTWWNETALVLEKNFPDPDDLDPWMKRVVDIFMDVQTDEKPAPTQTAQNTPT